MMHTYDIHKFRRKDKACLNFNMIFGQVNKRFLDVLEHWMLQGRPLPVVNGVKFPPQLSIYFTPICNQFVEVLLIFQKSHSTTTFLGCIFKRINLVTNGDVQLPINLPQLVSELKPEFFRHLSSNPTYSSFLDPPCRVNSNCGRGSPFTQRVAGNHEITGACSLYISISGTGVDPQIFAAERHLWRMGSQWM